MQHTFHCHLRKSFSWYHNWHNHPRHHHAHWLLFLVLVTTSFLFIAGQIRILNSENNASSFINFTHTALAQSFSGGPPFGDQGNCPYGFITLGEANASSADPAGTSGYYCDDDPDFARGTSPSVTQLTYPVTGRLYCGSTGSGYSFAYEGNQVPCNCRGPSDGVSSTCDYDPALPFNQFSNSPGWEFPNGINGSPRYRGGTVNLVAKHDCNDSGFTTFTATSGHNYGAYTQNPSRQGYVCIPGTDPSRGPGGCINNGYSCDQNPSSCCSGSCPAIVGSPDLCQPVPLSRHIFFTHPFLIMAGTPITISGENLTVNVNVYGSSATPTTVTGVINSDNTEVQVVIPASLIPGRYLVSVGPDPESNKVEIEISAGSYIPPVPASNPPPTITSINPTTVTNGDILEIRGTALGNIVQLIDIYGYAFAINGNISSDYGTVTIIIPPSIYPGIYTVSITTLYGTSRAADVLTVVASNPPVSASNPTSQSGPTATPFQDLISGAFNYSLIVVGIAVFIMIMWGGFLWLTSAANPANIGSAKKYIGNAVLGAVLLVSAYVILYTINPELIGFTFDLKGIQAPPPVTPLDCSNPQALAQRYDTAFPQPIPPNNRSTSWGGAPELDTLINCVLNNSSAGPLIDRSQIYTYQQNGNFNCNYTRGDPVCGACAHTTNSCHYGGPTGILGSLAVDFNASNNSTAGETALYNALRAIYSTCNMGWINYEQSGSSAHTHVSTVSCAGN